MSIYIHINQQTTGPFEDDAVTAWLQVGQLSPEALACRHGETQWQPLKNLLPGSAQPYTLAQPVAFPQLIETWARRNLPQRVDVKVMNNSIVFRLFCYALLMVLPALVVISAVSNMLAHGVPKDPQQLVILFVAAVPVGFYMAATNETHVIYRSEDDHIQDLYWTGDDAVQYQGQALTQMSPGAMLAVGSPAVYVAVAEGFEKNVFYRGTDNHIHRLHWTNGPVGNENLSSVAQSPLAAGDPVAYFVASHPILGTNDSAYELATVTYRAVNGHIYELWWAG